ADEILCKLSQIQKTLSQLLDWSKSITQEIRLLPPGPAITTTPLPPSAVFEDCNSNHEADDFDPSLPEDWERTSMTVNQEEARSVCLFVSSCEDRECTNIAYEAKFKHRAEVAHENPVVRQVAKFREGSCLDAHGFSTTPNYTALDKMVDLLLTRGVVSARIMNPLDYYELTKTKEINAMKLEIEATMQLEEANDLRIGYQEL
ncbi:hypothetical protein Prudu_006577, partial [Prunus dulcis]